MTTDTKVADGVQVGRMPIKYGALAGPSVRLLQACSSWELADIEKWLHLTGIIARSADKLAGRSRAATCWLILFREWGASLQVLGLEVEKAELVAISSALTRLRRTISDFDFQFSDVGR